LWNEEITVSLIVSLATRERPDDHLASLSVTCRELSSLSRDRSWPTAATPAARVRASRKCAAAGKAYHKPQSLLRQGEKKASRQFGEHPERCERLRHAKSLAREGPAA